MVNFVFTRGFGNPRGLEGLATANLSPNGRGITGICGISLGASMNFRT